VVRPFTVDVPTSEVAELRQRLGQARWPEGVTDTGGIAKAEMTRLVSHWRDAFDWGVQQASLNRHEHILVDVDDLQVHAVRFRPAHGTNVPPIILLHGWPGSFVELLPLASRLHAHFEVLVPSIPGFGFSSIPATPGVSNRRIAEVIVRLADALGYETFAVHGGDIGAGVASWMAIDHPERIRFLHLNFIPGSYSPEPAADITTEETDFLQRRSRWSDRYGAYGHLQRTTPLTVAYALTDSPLGLAAWILEKFILWSDPASRISDELLLTNLSVYWFTRTIGSSMRYYLESAATPLRLSPDQRVTAATHIAHFPHEMPFPPRSWVERRYAVTRWTTMARGGHFAALEAPDLLAEDILAAASRPALCS
jgi:pimeloyl-ACP methyl ester carboxylesterase